MRASLLSIILFVAAFACSSATPRPPPVRASAAQPDVTVAAVLDATDGSVVTADVVVVSAVERARAAAVGRREFTAEETTWLRARMLDVVMRASGALPAPTPHEVRDGVTSWTLVADAEVAPARFEGVCAAVDREEARVACATDVVPWSGSERARVALAWRGTASVVAINAAMPMRALSRSGEGLCLVHAERTLRTMDLTVRAADHETLGRALARMTVSPAMNELILVRAELGSAGLEAVLSWPLDRATGPLDMGDVVWPTRCEGRSVVGAEAMSGTVFVPREVVGGSAARGAVVRVGRREWLVTAGDRAGSADVVTVRENGVVARLRGRAATLRFPAQRAR